MYTIIIVEQTCSGIYTKDNPGYFVELRDKDINSACTVGTFNSPEQAQMGAVDKANSIGEKLGNIDYTGKVMFFPLQQFTCDGCGNIVCGIPNEVDFILNQGREFVCDACYKIQQI